MDKQSNVHKIELENKQVILIGTAHVSNKSAEDVEQVITTEKPDIIGVELDEKRYEAIKEADKNKGFTIEEFFKYLSNGKIVEYLFTLVLSIPQNRLAEKFNIKPGAEMLKGIELSEKFENKLILLDREISITIPRLINSIPFWTIPLLGLSSLFSLFAIEFISQEDIEKLRSGEQLDNAMEQLSSIFPGIKKVMIDERDKIIAKNILDSEGKKIVAILGAGHIKGVTKYLKEGIEGIDFDEINKIPDLNPFKNLF